MKHICQVQINPDTWTQYSGWFYIKNYNPVNDYSFDSATGVLTLLHPTVINDFYRFHPNLPYTTVAHSHV